MKSASMRSHASTCAFVANLIVTSLIAPSEETLEDVRTRMFSIQENEVVQLRELTNFLDLEITFVQSYLAELQKVKADWVDECVVSQRHRMRSALIPATGKR